MATSTATPAIKPTIDGTVITTDPPIVIPKPMLTVRACTNCKNNEAQRIQDGAAKVNEVVVTQCFRDGMEKRALIQTNGLTPSQVVGALIHADITIDAEMYWTIKRVLGYTLGDQLPGQFKEWLNRRYMMEWNVCDLASLLAHETSHKAGFDHDFKATSRRPLSVPYSINEVFKVCCTK